MRNELRSERGGPPEVTPWVPASPRREDDHVDQHELDDEGDWARESSNHDADDEDDEDDDDDDEDDDEEQVALPGPSHKRTRTAEGSSVEPQTVQKRPRGRPREGHVSQGQPQQQPKRGRGRPPKANTAGHGFTLGNATSHVRRKKSVVPDSQSGADAAAENEGPGDNQSEPFDTDGGFNDFGDGCEELAPTEVVQPVVQPEVVQPVVQPEVVQPVVQPVVVEGNPSTQEADGPPAKLSSVFAEAQELPEPGVLRQREIEVEHFYSLNRVYVRRECLRNTDPRIETLVVALTKEMKAE